METKYLNVMATAKKAWIDDEEAIDVFEQEPRAQYESLPIASVNAKQVLCIKCLTDPRPVTKAGRDYAFMDAELLEPFECWSRDEAKPQQFPAGTKVSIDLKRHAALYRTMMRMKDDLKTLVDTEVAVANLGKKSWTVSKGDHKGKKVTSYDYRVMLYAELLEKIGKKK